MIRPMCSQAVRARSGVLSVATQNGGQHRCHQLRPSRQPAGPATATGGEAVRDIDRAFRIAFAFTGSTALTCGDILPKCPSKNRVPWWNPAN